MRCAKCGHRRAKTGKCKFCHRTVTDTYQKTVRGKLRHRYRSMKQTSARRGWPAPNFTVTEFVEQFENDPVFLKLHADWKARSYNKWWSPSVDRIDADLPYQRGNISWKRWEENWSKSQVVDHKQYDCYQISMGGITPELPNVSGHSKAFNIRPEYSFDFGAFILSKKQMYGILSWDTYEGAEKYACDSGVGKELIRLAAHWEGTPTARSVRYVYGLCHPVLGFMSLPF